MNVLVADDDGIIRLLLTAALKTLGHSVCQASNGGEALAAWRQEHHSLVISDWMMPDLDGLELCRQVRAQKDCGFAYIILLTSRTGKANYLEAMEAGADDFLSKPFEQDQFAARVRVAQRILDLHENLRAANDDLERRVSERTEELQKALAAKREFLSRASHELRTPMNHMLGFAQVLKRSALPGTQEASVRHILESGRHLLTLIDRILAVSKSDSDDLGFLETSASAPVAATGLTSLQVAQ
ncbi:MAG: response regulator [Verrucomicrobiota bacterium]|nr:response regulator [Verrucomicrobiota bacterium]